MSQSLSFQAFNPPPIQYGAIYLTDSDLAFGLDCTSNMQARGTTISSIGTPIVQREDGVALDAGDVTVSNVTVASSGLTFSWMLTGNGNNGAYQVGFPLVLANGTTITRWIAFNVLSLIG